MTTANARPTDIIVSRDEARRIAYGIFAKVIDKARPEIEARWAAERAALGEVSPRP